MLGTLIAAVLGPELGDRARLAGGWPEFTGSFIAMAALMTLGAAVLGGLRHAQPRAARSTAVARPTRQILTQPAFIVAVLASTTAYAVMSFIMTATPISMFVEDGLTVLQTRHVISAHIVAMYAPSLASGLITRIVGLKRMMLLGVACMAACVVIAVLVGHHFIHYFWGLVLLGVGWNLLFVAGTTMLTQSYSLAERFKAQGIHDFATFGVQAAVSLLAGTAIISLGWARLNLLSVPMMAVMIGAVLWLHLRERSIA
jgi:MFS family permease